MVDVQLRVSCLQFMLPTSRNKDYLCKIAAHFRAFTYNNIGLGRLIISYMTIITLELEFSMPIFLLTTPIINSPLISFRFAFFRFWRLELFVRYFS